MNPVQPVHHAHRPWTPKEDKAIRRLYPSKGSAMAESIGRTQQATQRRASTLGVQLSDKARSAKNTRVISVDLGGPKITADLVEWAGKLADRYAARYGDPDGRYGPAASEALAKAWRSYRKPKNWARKQKSIAEAGAAENSEIRHESSSVRECFNNYAMMVVRRNLKQVRSASGLVGYRRTGSAPARPGPSIAHMGDDARLAPVREGWGSGPVGWEVDYADLIEGIARRLPGLESAVFRAVYLEAAGAGGDFGVIAGLLGISSEEATRAHGRAITMIRQDHYYSSRFSRFNTTHIRMGCQTVNNSQTEAESKENGIGTVTSGYIKTVGPMIPVSPPAEEIELRMLPESFALIRAGAGTAEVPPGASLGQTVRFVECERYGELDKPDRTGRWFVLRVGLDPGDFSRLVMEWPPVANHDIPRRD
jgi:hypothetical protein